MQWRSYTYTCAYVYVERGLWWTTYIWPPVSNSQISRFLQSPFRILGSEFHRILIAMANSEESSPLLPRQQETQAKNENNSSTHVAPATATPPPPADPVKPAPPAVIPVGWTANGLPLRYSVTGEPVAARAQWDSGLCSCLGRNDEFCSGDLEVCEFPQFLFHLPFSPYYQIKI